LDLNFRGYKRHDLKEILKIEAFSFSAPWAPKMFGALFQINPQGFYIAEKNGKLVGYAILLLESHIISNKLKLRAHLINLAVHPEKRRKGIGSSLLQYIQNDVAKHNVEDIFLEVRRSNSVAQEFYSKLLFKRVGLIEGFYVDEDAVVMQKDLSSGEK
jgi:ribosomal-protein-alanine N-acetyltransferase